MSYMSSLKDAIKEANVEAVKKIMQDPTFEVDNHHHDYYKSTPLMTAIAFCKPGPKRAEHIAIAKMFLEAGAKQANSVTWSGKPMFFGVVESDAVEIAELMLQKYGYSVKERSESVNGDDTLLSIVHSKEMCTLLLDAGLDPNILDEGSYSAQPPLFTANKETAEVLLARGAKIDALDKNGNSALMRVLQYVAKERENRIHKKEDMVPYAHFLLDKGASIWVVDSPTYNNNSPVKIVTDSYYKSNGEKEVVALYDRIIKLANETWETAPSVFWNYNNRSMITFYTQVGYGYHLDVLRTMKKNNINPYTRNNIKWDSKSTASCLMMAAMPLLDGYGYRVCKYLNFCDLLSTMYDDWENSVVKWGFPGADGGNSKVTDKEEIRETLKGWFNEAIVRAVQLSDLSEFPVKNPFLEKLLEPKYKEWVDLKRSVDEEGHNVLAYANSVKHAERLIALGADFHHLNKEKQSLLFHSRFSIEVFKFYVSKGLDLEHRDNNFDTPLSHYCVGVTKGYDSKDKISHLIEKGAKVGAKNKNGDSALSLADKIGSASPYNSKTVLEIKMKKDGLTEDQKKEILQAHEHAECIARMKMEEARLEMEKQFSMQNRSRCGADAEEVLREGRPCCHEEVAKIMHGLNLDWACEDKQRVIETIAMRCMCVAMTDSEIMDSILTYSF